MSDSDLVWYDERLEYNRPPTNTQSHSVPKYNEVTCSVALNKLAFIINLLDGFWPILLVEHNKPFGTCNTITFGHFRQIFL